MLCDTFNLNNALGASSENSEHDDMHRTLAEDTESGLPGDSPAEDQSVLLTDEAPGINPDRPMQQQDVPSDYMASESEASPSFPPLDVRIFANVTSGCEDPVVLSYVRYRIMLRSELSAADQSRRNAMVRSALSGKTRPPATLTPEQEREASLILEAYYDFVQRG